MAQSTSLSSPYAAVTHIGRVTEKTAFLGCPTGALKMEITISRMIFFLLTSHIPFLFPIEQEHYAKC